MMATTKAIVTRLARKIGKVSPIFAATTTTIFDSTNRNHRFLSTNPKLTTSATEDLHLQAEQPYKQQQQQQHQHNTTTNNNSTVLPRTNISIVGAVNAGKSVLMNLLTQSNTSIVHETAGTTTDPKVCTMELHGRIGPVRLSDTPGINEVGQLGLLKKEKAIQTIRQCDVAVVVADPFAVEHTVECVPKLLDDIQKRQLANQIMNQVSLGEKSIGTSTSQQQQQQQQHPVALLVYNLRQDKVEQLERQGGSVSLLLEELETKLLERLMKLQSQRW